jgi:hypothetical protein
MLGAIPPLPKYAFMTWCAQLKHRDNFTFTFTLYPQVKYKGKIMPYHYSMYENWGNGGKAPSTLNLGTSWR